MSDDGLMAILRTSRGDFETIIDGPEDGPVVMLLHGFPELNVSWRHQIPALTAAGFRVVAPNQRGYDGSVRDGSYATANLAADVVAILDAVGADTATIVGHDWGGGVAWTTASLYPQRVERLVAMNCPPPQVLSHELLTNPAQLLKSWYMVFFQLPLLPERFVSKMVPGALIGGSYNRDAWKGVDLSPYERAFATPELARGPINWYRGAFRNPTQMHGLPRITVPVLIIWGVEDRFLGLELIAPQTLRRAISYGNEPHIALIEQAGHFVQNEAPDKVNAALLRFLA